MDTLEAIFPGIVLNINDGVVSCPWSLPDGSKIQVDFVCRPNNFEDSLAYRSYAPFGHICGAIFDENGFSLGEHGLYIKVTGKRSGTKSFRVCDFRQALQFIDIRPVALRQGFDTEQEMFDFFITNPYFRWNRFIRRDKAAHPAMERLADRVQPLVDSGDSLTNITAKVDTDRIVRIFGDRWLRSAEIHEKKDAVLKEFREHVNGNTVGEVTELRGQELGEVMKEISKIVQPLIEHAAEHDLDPIAMLAVELVRKRVDFVELFKNSSLFKKRNEAGEANAAA